MHGRKWTFVLFGLALLVIAALAGFLLTQQAGGPKLLARSAAKSAPAAGTQIDQSLFRTAVSLGNAPSTAEEQELALEAVHIADRDVDMVFASALQKAKQTPPPQPPETAEISRRIHFLGERLQTSQEQVEHLTKIAANPGHADSTAIHQQLELAQAQVALYQDALDAAKQDLTRAGGDPEAVIQQELEEHEAIQHGGSGSGASPSHPTKPESFQTEGDLVSQFRTWQHLRQTRARLVEAQKQATASADELANNHEALEKRLAGSFQADDSDLEEPTAAASATSEANQNQHAAKLAKINKLSQHAKTLSLYHKRIELERQLANVYGDWVAVVDAQQRQALHAILRSLLWIFLALFGLALAEGMIERFYLKLGPDRRRLGTTRLALRFVSQTIGVLVVLLVLFGLPSQLSTVLALAGAGLTVALKDFIVAFFGWFILMGRNGIRVGDWVEINGIGGEVMEVGLLRTILLETGNWNDAGHPTGRRVSFVNSFAVEGHYFNFTTTGQWLWDELDILIPAGEDPYDLTTSVLKLVTGQTQADAALAEQEWKRVTHNSAIQSFSAVPAIEVRPTNLGVNLVVRYVVNAHTRHEVRTRLYQAIVELLHSKKLTQTGIAGAVASS